jgi:hypothetical protein
LASGQKPAEKSIRIHHAERKPAKKSERQRSTALAADFPNPVWTAPATVMKIPPQAEEGRLCRSLP